MKRIYSLLLAFVLIFNLQTLFAQELKRSPKAHSHNDYEQKRPFDLAIENTFGSIEADVWLKDNTLCVAHDAKDIQLDRTLENLYFNKLNTLLQNNKGRPYKDQRELQLLIDIKSDAKSTLEELIGLLNAYPSIKKSKYIKIVISGNRPVPAEYTQYPSFIFFDGRPNESYDKKSLKKLGLISDNYMKYSKWFGNGSISEKDKSTLKAVIQKSHDLKKPFRFWATPDNENSWNLFMELGVDYINTDKVAELGAFLLNKN
ncbi:MAG: hypothetical protein RLZ10_435 [Bacteroidota bacterium]|jgi:alkaline phosphatase